MHQSARTPSPLTRSFVRALAKRRWARARGQASAPVTLQDLLMLHGDASLVVVLLVLAVLTVVPIAGVGTLLSFALVAIAWRWAFDAQHQAALPFARSLRAVALSPPWDERTLRFLAVLYARADRWLHPRWQGIFHARWAPLWALWIAVMAAVIFLPLPLGNVLPSLSLVLLCLSWMFRDGLASMASLIVGCAALAYTAAFAHLLLSMLQSLRGWWGGVLH